MVGGDFMVDDGGGWWVVILWWMMVVDGGFNGGWCVRVYIMYI